MGSGFVTERLGHHDIVEILVAVEEITVAGEHVAVCVVWRRAPLLVVVSVVIGGSGDDGCRHGSGEEEGCCPHDDVLLLIAAFCRLMGALVQRGYYDSAP